MHRALDARLSLCYSKFVVSEGEIYMKDDSVNEHESYVLVQFNRVGGGRDKLFGSQLKVHNNVISLKVSKAQEITDEYGDVHYYAKANSKLIEVELSSAQFAELITTMNIGSGIPGTMTAFNGKSVEPPPKNAEMPIEKVRNSFQSTMDKACESITSMRKELQVLLNKKTLTANDKQEIIKAFTQAELHIKNNAPYVLDRFEEAAEKVVASAKAEIDATITHNIFSRGVASLKADNTIGLLSPASPPRSDDVTTKRYHFVDFTGDKLEIVKTLRKIYPRLGFGDIRYLLELVKLGDKPKLTHISEEDLQILTNFGCSFEEVNE